VEVLKQQRLQGSGQAETAWLDGDGGKSGRGGCAASQARAPPRARCGLKIHYEELDALREAEDNPNQHSKEQITLMERLLVEYGWITPMGNRRRAGLRPRQVGVSLAAMSPTSPTL
jgi:hypothetical protein